MPASSWIPSPVLKDGILLRALKPGQVLWVQLLEESPELLSGGLSHSSSSYQCKRFWPRAQSVFNLDKGKTLVYQGEQMVMSRAVEVRITQQWLASQAHSGTEPGKWEVAKPSLVVRYCDQKGRPYHAHKLVCNCPRKLLLMRPACTSLWKHMFAPVGMTCIWLQSSWFSSALMKAPGANTDQNTRDCSQHGAVKLPRFLSNSQTSSPSLDWGGESTSLPHPLKPPSRPYPGISKCPAL